MNIFKTKDIGDIGEEYVAKFLRKKKYKILERNYRKNYGEVDIIASNKEYIIFVEVKTRHIESMTQPVDAVDKQKQRKIIKTAAAYLLENDTDKYARFDVCEVYIDSKTLKVININYIENAFIQEGGYAPY